MPFRKSFRRRTRRFTRRPRRFGAGRQKRFAYKGFRGRGPSRAFGNPTIPWKRVIPSKNITLYNVATSTGASLSISNAGMLNLTSSTLQGTDYMTIGMSFCLNDVPGISDIAASFDRYKIVGVKLNIIPVNNVSLTVDPASGASNGSLGGFLHWILDYDDRTVPTASDVGIDSFRQYHTYRMSTLTRPMKRYLRPRIATAVYGAGAFSSYANDKSRWIDLASPFTEHYGVKFIFEVVNPSAATHFLNFKFETTMYFLTKDPR